MICPLPGINKEAMKGVKSGFVLQVVRDSLIQPSETAFSDPGFVNSSGNAIMISSTFKCHSRLDRESIFDF